MRHFLLGLAIPAALALGAGTAHADQAADKVKAEKIGTVIRDSGQIKNYRLGVKCSGGTVWLDGSVTSSQQQAAALEIVGNIEGIERIVNNLAIQPATRQLPRPSAPSTLNSPRGAHPASGQRTNNRSQVKQATANMPAGMQAPQMMADNAQVPQGYAVLGGQPPAEQVAPPAPAGAVGNRPLPVYGSGVPAGVGPVAYDQPHMPNYAWPSYAAHPNYAGITYPKQYSPTAWPYIGPFYPYPQVPLGWRKVSLEWDDGWWFLDFDDRGCY